MKLTGKARCQFDEFVYNTMTSCFNLTSGHDWVTLENFYLLPPSMQFGVYQDFADSVGYELRITQNDNWFFASIKEHLFFLSKPFNKFHDMSNTQKITRHNTEEGIFTVEQVINMNQIPNPFKQ